MEEKILSPFFQAEVRSQRASVRSGVAYPETVIPNIYNTNEVTRCHQGRRWGFEMDNNYINCLDGVLPHNVHMCDRSSFMSPARFWHITDLHLDPTYHQSLDPTTVCFSSKGVPVTKAGMFGDFLCDSPYSLIQSAFSGMAKRTVSQDFVIWTGLVGGGHLSRQNFSDSYSGCEWSVLVSGGRACGFRRVSLPALAAVTFVWVHTTSNRCEVNEEVLTSSYQYFEVYFNSQHMLILSYENINLNDLYWCWLSVASFTAVILTMKWPKFTYEIKFYFTFRQHFNTFVCLSETANELFFLNLCCSDSPPHVPPGELSTKMVIDVMTNMTQTIRQNFPNLMVFPALGNHDYWPQVMKHLVFMQQRKPTMSLQTFSNQLVPLTPR